MNLQRAREYANQFVFSEQIESALESIQSGTMRGWAPMELDMMEAVLESNLSKAPSVYDETLPAMESISEGVKAFMEYQRLMSEASATRKQMKALEKEGNTEEACQKAREIAYKLQDFLKLLETMDGGIPFYLLAKLIGWIVPLAIVGGGGTALKAGGRAVNTAAMHMLQRGRATKLMGKMWWASLEPIKLGDRAQVIAASVAMIAPVIGTLEVAKDFLSLAKAQRNAREVGDSEPTIDQKNRIINAMKRDVIRLIQEYTLYDARNTTREYYYIENDPARAVESFIFTEQIETALECIEGKPEYAALENALIQRMGHVFSVDESPQAMQYCWMQPLDVAMEGVVMDAKTMKKNRMRVIRQIKAEAKRLARKHQYSAACEKLNQCITELQKLKKEITDLPDSEKSYILSQVVGLLGNIILSVIVGAISSEIGAAGGLGTIAKNAIGRLQNGQDVEFEDMGPVTISDEDYTYWDGVEFGRQEGYTSGYRNGKLDSSDHAGSAATILGMIAAAAKFGLQSGKMLMTAKKAKQAAADPEKVKLLNENNKLLRAVQSDIDRVILGLKGTIKRWQKKEAEYRSKQEAKSVKQEAKATRKAEKENKSS